MTLNLGLGLSDHRALFVCVREYEMNYNPKSYFSIKKLAYFFNYFLTFPQEIEKVNWLFFNKSLTTENFNTFFDLFLMGVFLGNFAQTITLKQNIKKLGHTNCPKVLMM